LMLLHPGQGIETLQLNALRKHVASAEPLRSLGHTEVISDRYGTRQTTKHQVMSLPSELIYMVARVRPDVSE
jgi:hypothetical protein